MIETIAIVCGIVECIGVGVLWYRAAVRYPSVFDGSISSANVRKECAEWMLIVGACFLGVGFMPAALSEWSDEVSIALFAACAGGVLATVIAGFIAQWAIGHALRTALPDRAAAQPKT